MRRRALLASLGMAGLSGCAGMLADGAEPGTSQPATRTQDLTETAPTTGATTADGTTTTTDETTDATEHAETTTEDDYEWPPGASVVDFETGPRTLALAPLQYRSNDGAEVTVEFASTATADDPATVRATLTNASDYPNTFRLDETPPFMEVTDARLRDRRDFTYKATWYIVPTANHDLADASPDYVRGPEGYWRLAGQLSPKLPRTTRLDPGESIEGEWVLLGHSEGSGRPLGTYEFRGHGDATLSITAWETGAPGPAEESRFAGASPPRLSDDEDGSDGGQTAGPHWYHDAGPGTGVYLEPSAERVRTPARIDFTLYNYARESATGNPYDWTLYKLVDGEWFHVAPWAVPLPMSSVAPGDTEDWTLYAFDGDEVQVDDGTALGYLGGGRYAFEVGMSRDDRSHAALVELAGPSVEVEPMPGAEATRDGTTVTVDAPDPEHDQPPGTLVLTRADAADERLIPEQVMRRQYRTLRNGLPFFEDGVERVVVETTQNAAQRVTGYDSGTRGFRFEEQAYEARFESASDE